jgi:hypothetical protein
MKLSRPLVLICTLMAAACGGSETAESAEPLPLLAEGSSDLPTVLVYKTPTCGCCNGWIEHLRAAGFTVDARNTTDLMTIKMDAGVPTPMMSCHTALVDGYVVEGHVPAEQLKRLLAERPDLAGIAVPGMPAGSPGMESSNPQPYQVLSFDNEGNAAVFADIDPSDR